MSKQASSSSGEVRVGCAWIEMCKWNFSWRRGRGVEASEEFVGVVRNCARLERKFGGLVLTCPARSVKIQVKMHNDSSRRGARLGESAAFGDVGLGGGGRCSPAPSQSTPEFTSCRSPSPASFPVFTPRNYHMLSPTFTCAT
jgi:hypothetical protein